MGADASVVKRFCNYMSTKERAHYLNTFKRNGKTIAENIAIDMQDILKEKFNCVVYEPMLVDIVEINEKECRYCVNASTKKNPFTTMLKLHK